MHPGRILFCGDPHGHQHDKLDSSGQWNAQGFQSFGVGLRGMMAVDGFDDFLGSVERSSHGHTPTHERDPFEGMPGSIELSVLKSDN